MSRSTDPRTARPGRTGAEPRTGAERSTPWWRQGVITLTVMTVAVPTAFLAVLLTAVAASVPDPADLPVLPAGVHAVRDTVTCGSGGCARELTLEGPPGSSLRQIADMLHLPAESCRNNGLLDFKRRCTGVTSVGDEIRLYVSVSDFWK